MCDDWLWWYLLCIWIRSRTTYVLASNITTSFKETTLCHVVVPAWLFRWNFISMCSFVDFNDLSSIFFVLLSFVLNLQNLVDIQLSQRNLYWISHVLFTLNWNWHQQKLTLLVHRVRSWTSRIAQLGLGFMNQRWCGGRVARSAPWPRTNSGEIDDSALSASVASASAVAPTLPSPSIRYFTQVFVATSDHFVARHYRYCYCIYRWQHRKLVRKTCYRAEMRSEKFVFAFTMYS